jgi:hypothetical protein
MRFCYWDSFPCYFDSTGQFDRCTRLDAMHELEYNFFSWISSIQTLFQRRYVPYSIDVIPCSIANINRIKRTYRVCAVFGSTSV